MSQFLFFGSNADAKAIGAQLLENSNIVNFKAYTLSVTVPTALSAQNAGTITKTLRIDGGGPFLMLGMSSKFDFVADLPTVKFTLQNQSKQGYYYFKDPTPLDLVSNVGKNGNQFFVPGFPLVDTLNASDALQFSFENSSTTDTVQVDITLFGYQWSGNVEALI